MVIGLDLSINSTGVCINNQGKYNYFIITSKMTRKMQSFKHKKIKYVLYDKQEVVGEYSDKEKIKTTNINNIVREIEKIVTRYKPEQVNIEGISFGSTGSAALIDLTGLNFMVRKMLIEHKIGFKIISPTSNKKFATGNGSAEKDVMIDAWKRLDNDISNVTEVKIDDLADAFFLSCYVD